MKKSQPTQETGWIKSAMVLLLTCTIVSYTLIVHDTTQPATEVINMGASDEQIADYIKTYQDGQYGKRGKYAQLTESKMPVDGADQLPSSVKNSIPDNVEVFVYDGPNGKGYQINWLESTTTTDRLGNVRTEKMVVKSVGFGPEAKQRTWQK